MPSSRLRPLLAALMFLIAVPADAPAAEQPPPHVARAYVDAGARFGVAPRLLPAIGYNESRHGRAGYAT